MTEELRPPANYFPISRDPFIMSAGLYRFGHDFGNGAVDGHIFQRDANAAVYRDEKERVLESHPDRLCEEDNQDAFPLKRKIFEWMCGRLLEEHQLDLGNNAASLSPSELLLSFRKLSLCIQEDFALLRETESGQGVLELLSICFPSGWKPESLLGKGFQHIHAPVPGFENLNRKRARLVHAMIHRGPYVRFVWSLAADSRLDHHPDHAPRDSWRTESRGYLRVERQVTVPFPDVGGSLFLIRTYLYPLDELSAQQRGILYEATEALPASIRAYKGLTAETTAVLARAVQPELRGVKDALDFQRPTIDTPSGPENSD